MSACEAFHFRLYVAGDSWNSAQAIANLRALCLERLPGRHTIDILLLGRAQEHARQRETRQRTDILDVLPAQVALLDASGRILMVNEAWRIFACANGQSASSSDVGRNYLGA